MEAFCIKAVDQSLILKSVRATRKEILEDFWLDNGEKIVKIKVNQVKLAEVKPFKSVVITPVIMPLIKPME